MRAAEIIDGHLQDVFTSVESQVVDDEVQHQTMTPDEDM